MIGASGRTRTDMSLRSTDFESIASTSSTTEAVHLLYRIVYSLFNHFSIIMEGEPYETFEYIIKTWTLLY